MKLALLPLLGGISLVALSSWGLQGFQPGSTSVSPQREPTKSTSFAPPPRLLPSFAPDSCFLPQPVLPDPAEVPWAEEAAWNEQRSWDPPPAPLTEAVAAEEVDLPPLGPESLPYVVLLNLGHEIVLRGDVPNEKSRLRLVEKARTRFPSHRITDALRICSELSPPTEGLDLTLHSFPTAAPETSPGLMAAAVLGQPWFHCRLSAHGATVNDLLAVGLFPQNFANARAFKDCEILLDYRPAAAATAQVN